MDSRDDIGSGGLDPAGQDLALLGALVEEQQATLQQLLAKLDQSIGQTREAVGEIRQAGGELGEAVRSSVRETLKDQAKASIEQAAAPVLERLKGQANELGQQTGLFWQALQWLGWRWVALCLVGALAVAVVTSGLTWWLMRGTQAEVSQLRQQREQLAQEVATLQGSQDELKADADRLMERIEMFARSKGTGVNVARCKVKAAVRLCVEVDPAAGQFGDAQRGRFQVLAVH